MPQIKPISLADQKATIYQIFLRNFTPEGTLKSAKKMLGHLQELGVDILYLCPVAEADADMDPNGWSPRQKSSGLDNPKNPYRIKDYYKIDPEYGADDDLKDFVTSAHRLGMRVILDLVYLHCGPSAPFIVQHPEYVQRNTDGSIKTNEYNFPLINFESNTLREYLWQNMEHFVREFDVDGYRCDVAFEIPLDFWEGARPRLEAIKPDIFMLSESLGNEAEQAIAFDVSYGVRFPHEVHDVLRKKMNAADLRDFQNRLDAKVQSARILRAIDNHDLASDFQERRADAGYPFEAVNCMLALCFSLEGMPFLYNGQEVADTNLHSIWANREHGHNNVVDWSNALTERGQARLALVKKLISLKKQEAALFAGTREWIENDQPAKIFSFCRKTKNETIIAAFNFCNSTVQTILDCGSKVKHYESLIQAGTRISTQSDALSVDCLPFGYFIIKISQ